MRKTRGVTTDWRTEIERSGYYPGLVVDAVESTLAAEAVESFVVHHEATFDPGMEVRRHITVLLLTPTRLIVCHTDEHPATSQNPKPHATTTTEANKIDNVYSVALSRVVPDPATYTPGTPPTEVVMAVNLSGTWGGVAQLDLEPASCGDDSCEADHGYTGAITAEPLTIRVSEAADGADAVQHLLDFAQALSKATT